MQIDKLPLFLDDKTSEFFRSLPAQRKRPLIAFLRQIIACEQVDTPDAKQALTQQITQWLPRMDDPAYAQFRIHLRRFQEDAQLLPGDLRRHTYQILEELMPEA